LVRLIRGRLRDGRPKLQTSDSGIGHELIHTENINNGKYIDPITKQTVFDPDHNLEEREMPIEEINTREAENVIRKEQGVKKRAIPIIQ
jgi:hypothetical protein